jgi:DNA-binding beta-propeller fold protein YncE
MLNNQTSAYGIGLGCLVLFTLLASAPREVQGDSKGGGTVVLMAGGGDGADGAQATKARLQAPFGVDFDQAGNLYFVEYAGHRVRHIDAKGILTTIGGTGRKGGGGDGGPAREAEFNAPHSLAVAANGDIYVADTGNNRVRKIDAKSGKITSVAGTGEKGFAGDGGPAVEARFGNIYCVALNPRRDRLYLADLDNRRIRSVDLATGVVTTVAGNGHKGTPEDGSEAVKAPLVDPRAVAVDARNNIYILERSGNALRVVDATGKIRTVAGTGKAGATGDGGDARHATLNGPKHLCIDRDGGVLIADTENHLLRKYLADSGKIVRVTGSGKRGAGGVGGPAASVELSQPHGVYVHRDGALYIADSSNDRILKIERRD